jgi:ethanolamine utilization microcompartment shell protein EutL
MAVSGCGTIKIIASDETVPVEETAVVYPYSEKLGKEDGVT